MTRVKDRGVVFIVLKFRINLADVTRAKKRCLALGGAGDPRICLAKQARHQWLLATASAAAQDRVAFEVAVVGAWIVERVMQAAAFFAGEC